MTPDLDAWLPETTLRVAHRRPSRASVDDLWRAAQEVTLSETAVLGRLVRWRIPGVAREITFDGLLRSPPFLVLEEGERVLVSGLVGSIWTLRRDYPQLADPAAFHDWSRRGTARVVLASWVRETEGGSELVAEARVQAIGAQGRVGVAAVRPVVRAFQHLIATEGLRAAVRRAEGG